jgi:Mg-chelatase subunit ChlD
MRKALLFVLVSILLFSPIFRMEAVQATNTGVVNPNPPSGSNITIPVNSSKEISLGNNINGNDFKWQTNSDIISLSATKGPENTVTVNGAGEAKVIVTHGTGGGELYYWYINRVPATSIILDKNTINANVRDAPVTLHATVIPANATNKDIVWTSNNESVAKVSNGVVTFVQNGNAIVTAKVANTDISAACTVAVGSNNTKTAWLEGKITGPASPIQKLQTSSVVGDLNVNMDAKGVAPNSNRDPVDVVFVVDKSFSMGGILGDIFERLGFSNKLKSAQNAIGDAIVKFKENTDKLGLVPFASKVDETNVVPLDSNYTLIKNKLGGLGTDTLDELKSGVLTNYTDSLRRAKNILLSDPNDKQKKYIIFLTDGKPDVSVSNLNGVIDELTREKIKAYSIGFGNNKELDMDLLNRISKATGGRAEQVTSGSIDEIYKGISGEITQPILGEVQAKVNIKDDGLNNNVSLPNTVDAHMEGDYAVINMKEVVYAPNGGPVLNGQKLSKIPLQFNKPGTYTFKDIVFTYKYFDGTVITTNQAEPVTVNILGSKPVVSLSVSDGEKSGWDKSYPGKVTVTADVVYGQGEEPANDGLDIKVNNKAYDGTINSTDPVDTSDGRKKINYTFDLMLNIEINNPQNPGNLTNSFNVKAAVTNVQGLTSDPIEERLTFCPLTSFNVQGKVTGKGADATGELTLTPTTLVMDNVRYQWRYTDPAGIDGGTRNWHSFNNLNMATGIKLKTVGGTSIDVQMLQDFNGDGDTNDENETIGSPSPIIIGPAEVDPIEEWLGPDRGPIAIVSPKVSANSNASARIEVTLKIPPPEGIALNPKYVIYPVGRLTLNLNDFKPVNTKLKDGKYVFYVKPNQSKKTKYRVAVYLEPLYRDGSNVPLTDEQRANLLIVSDEFYMEYKAVLK